MALVDLENAQAAVTDALDVLGVEVIESHLAMGHVTSEAVHSPDQVPPFNNSAVDGFAVRSSDLPSGYSTLEQSTDLRLVGTVAAGDNPTVVVGEGECVRIMTGAAMPEGADAVVMVEDAAAADQAIEDMPAAEIPDGARVRLAGPIAPGRAVRVAGDDLDSGDIAIASGTELRPAHIGLLATVGATKVAVFRKPKVGVLSTGDELVGDGSALVRGQIRDSNRAMLLSACASAGFDAVDLGLIADDEDQIERALRDGASRFDALITSGGVSMGDFDFVKAVLARIAEMQWMQIAIKPAKPFAFGFVDGCPIFGLPGNPVSSLVSFELLALPGLRKLQGNPRLHTLRVPAVLGEDFKRRADGKTHFVRVVLAKGGDGSLVAVPSGAQGSHQLAASASAEAFAAIPDGNGLPAGCTVEVMLL